MSKAQAYIYCLGEKITFTPSPSISVLQSVYELNPSSHQEPITDIRRVLTHNLSSVAQIARMFRLELRNYTFDRSRQALSNYQRETKGGLEQTINGSIAT